jgi:hypothetical protein
MPPTHSVRWVKMVVSSHPVAGGLAFIEDIVAGVVDAGADEGVVDVVVDELIVGGVSPGRKIAMVCILLASIAVAATAPSASSPAYCAMEGIII